MMRLPGVLNINGQYFIKVDEGAIKLPSNVSTNTLEFAYLTMYILNLNSPDAPKNVFLFFEKFLQIEPSIFSQDVHCTTCFVITCLINQKWRCWINPWYCITKFLFNSPPATIIVNKAKFCSDIEIYANQSMTFLTEIVRRGKGDYENMNTKFFKKRYPPFSIILLLSFPTFSKPPRVLIISTTAIQYLFIYRYTFHV